VLVTTGIIVAIIIIIIFFVPAQDGKSVSNIYIVPAGTFSPLHWIIPDLTWDAAGTTVITVDPLPEYLTGEMVTVSGTTTLPAGEVLDIAWIKEPFHTTKCDPGKFCGSGTCSTIVTAGEERNSWSFALNTSGFPAGGYDIWIVATSSPNTSVHTVLKLGNNNGKSFKGSYKENLEKTAGYAHEAMPCTDCPLPISTPPS